MKIITKDLLREMFNDMATSPRNRAHHSFRGAYTDASLFLIAGNKKTYWPPHKHEGRWETSILYSGKLGVLTFDRLGNVKEKIILDHKNAFAAEFDPGEIHSFVAISPKVVFMDCKQGPYNPQTDKAYPSWAPAENSAEATNYLKKLHCQFSN